MQNAAMIFFYVIAGFCTFFVWGGTVNGSVWWGNARGETGAAAWGRADGIQDGECQAERAEDPLAVST